MEIVLIQELPLEDINNRAMEEKAAASVTAEMESFTKMLDPDYVEEGE